VSRGEGMLKGNGPFQGGKKKTHKEEKERGTESKGNRKKGGTDHKKTKKFRVPPTLVSKLFKRSSGKIIVEWEPSGDPVYETKPLGRRLGLCRALSPSCMLCLLGALARIEAFLPL